jgi:hypothetical protein
VVGGNPIGNFETIRLLPGAVRVEGWTIDPDTNGPISVHVYVDSNFAGSFLANGNRPDVGAAFPGYGSAHGFVADIPASAGTHQFCVYAIDKPGPGVNPALGCRSASR